MKLFRFGSKKDPYVDFYIVAQTQEEAREGVNKEYPDFDIVLQGCAEPGQVVAFFE